MPRLFEGESVWILFFNGNERRKKDTRTKVEWKRINTEIYFETIQMWKRKKFSYRPSPVANSNHVYPNIFKKPLNSNSVVIFWQTIHSLRKFLKCKQNQKKDNNGYGKTRTVGDSPLDEVWGTIALSYWSSDSSLKDQCSTKQRKFNSYFEMEIFIGYIWTHKNIVKGKLVYSKI